MPFDKGLQWNQNQLGVLYHLQQGMTPEEIHEQYGNSIALINKVIKAQDSGDSPGTVTQEMIDSAPDSVPFGGFHENTPKLPKQASAPMTKKAHKIKLGDAIPVSQMTGIDLVLQTGTMPMTPDIHISYMLALNNGYRESLGDWITMCCRDFWLGRGTNMYQEYSNLIMGMEGENGSESDGPGVPEESGAPNNAG